MLTCKCHASMRIDPKFIFVLEETLFTARYKVILRQIAKDSAIQFTLVLLQMLCTKSLLA